MQQNADKKLLKKLLIFIGVFTFAIILQIQFNGIRVFAYEYANSKYQITTTDITSIKGSALGSVAEISGSDNVITIKLTADVNDMIFFNVDSKDIIFVLDADGHTINGSGKNEAIQLANENYATVILKGNGTYKPGNNNTVFSGWHGKLIIESGTFFGGGSNRLIYGYAYFCLAEGYDYYTAATNEGNLFTAYNRIEKSKYDLSGALEKLVVNQCKGEIPSYKITSAETDNGTFSFLVNGEPADTAKPDDTITVNFFPDTNYRFSRVKVLKEDGTYYYGMTGSGADSWDFTMPDSNITIEVTYVWSNQIITQPTAKNPTIKTNNPDGVTSYQWYATSTEYYLAVDGTPETGEVSLEDKYGIYTYDDTTKTWFINDFFIYIYLWL
ncbi:MAG: hypothetical protein ACFWTJ_13910 [Lachnoclostridium sp.]